MKKCYIEWSALYVYSMNLSHYRAGRARMRSFSKKWRYICQNFGPLHWIIYLWLLNIYSYCTGIDRTKLRVIEVIVNHLPCTLYSFHPACIRHVLHAYILRSCPCIPPVLHFTEIPVPNLYASSFLKVPKTMFSRLSTSRISLKPFNLFMQFFVLFLNFYYFLNLFFIDAVHFNSATGVM